MWKQTAPSRGPTLSLSHTSNFVCRLNNLDLAGVLAEPQSSLHVSYNVHSKPVLSAPQLQTQP